VTHDRGHSVTHDCHDCASMSHVTTTSCSWSRFSSPSVVYALAHVTSTRKWCWHAPPCGGGDAAKNRLAEGTYEGVLVARVGVRDKVGPQCVTERSTHVLGDSPEQPAPALLCALAPHLAQFDRVGGLVGTQAMSLHPRAAVVPWLREPAITARSRVRAWRRLGGRPWCRRR
jgi:hypothetical protein